MLLREHFSAPHLKRRPEPQAMEKSESVAAFHRQGAAGGALLPVYHFNALAVSRLIPRGGTLLDLGSGSGQFLAHLARVRPDISITGLDLSPAMVELGNESLRQMGLSARVKLQTGDMTNFRTQVTGPVSAISCIFACHHLPGEDELRACLAEISAMQSSCACGVWIFDHLRPMREQTAEDFPQIFLPDAPEVFRNDARNSLVASFSFEVLSELLQRSGIAAMTHVKARLLPLYQVHFNGALHCNGGHSISPASWRGNHLFHLFRALLKDVPLCKCRESRAKTNL
jgi:SAM-dependent methyltransferase